MLTHNGPCYLATAFDKELVAARHQAHSDQAVLSPDQRQSGTLQPNLALRVGRRPPRSLRGGQNPSPRQVASHVQPSSAPHGHRWTTRQLCHNLVGAEHLKATVGSDKEISPGESVSNSFSTFSWELCPQGTGSHGCAAELAIRARGCRKMSSECPTQPIGTMDDPGVVGSSAAILHQETWAPAPGPSTAEPVDPASDVAGVRCSGPRTPAKMCSRCPTKMSMRSRHSRRIVPTKRSKRTCWPVEPGRGANDPAALRPEDFIERGETRVSVSDQELDGMSTSASATIRVWGDLTRFWTGLITRW